MHELVPSTPSIVGSTDTAGKGVGGVHFAPLPTSTNKHPLHNLHTWWSTFLTNVVDCLITQENPKGSITNSDLELTVMVAHHNVITSQHRATEASISTLHDNFAAVMWNSKRSAATEGPAAHLL